MAKPKVSSGGIIRFPGLRSPRLSRLTLGEVISLYGCCLHPPGPGDKVLFEGAEDYIGASINLGEVVATWADQDGTTATVLVTGIRTYLPGGRQQQFRGKRRFTFPATHFLCPIEERLLAHSRRWLQKAADTSEWVAQLRGQASENSGAGAHGAADFSPCTDEQKPRPDNVLPFVTGVDPQVI